MSIPFLSLKDINQPYAQELEAAARRVIASGWYINGKECLNFEDGFSRYLNVGYCCGVGNGYDALFLSFRALIIQGRLKPGDKVAVPANTFIASALAVTGNDLVPCFVDAQAGTYNICSDTLRLACEQNTVKAVLVVHLYGRVADMENISGVAEDYGLLVVEDCAQSQGAELNEVKAGVFGDVAAFSFYPGKNLGALGDGGAVVSNDEELNGIVRALGSYGSSEKYVHDLKGVNSRLDELQAAFLSVKLKYLDLENNKRREIARKYTEGITNLRVQLPIYEDGNRSVWHLYVLRLEDRDLL